MRAIGFGAALLLATAANSESVSYSCPKGWEQSGDNCTRTTPVRPITRTETSYHEVPAIESCPAGYEVCKDSCCKTIPLALEARTVSHQVPTKVCPKGAQQTKDGCIITKTVTGKVAEQNHKQVTSQRVSKKSQYISVKKPVSVSSGPAAKTVTTAVAGYDVVEVPKTLKVPKDEKVVTESCGTGKGASCTVKVANQQVKESSREKNVSVAQLVDKHKELTLRSKVKVAHEVCPQGSTETKGACVVKLTRQVIKTQQKQRAIGSGALTQEVTKTLKVAKTSLVPKYSCPQGTQSKGATCTVTRTAQSPVTKETPRTVRVARAVKVPKTVKVPKVVAVASTECPKGASTGKGGKGKGVCTLATTIRVPYTVETPVSVCPGGAKEDNGVCIVENKKYASPEQVEAYQAPQATKDVKGKGAAPAGPVRQECPPGYQKDSVGLCYTIDVDTVAPETITQTKVEFKTETVEEIVPAITTYTTKTEYEEATVEEIKVEYSTEEVTETSTELASTTYTDEIPAIATYEPVTTYEEVTVTDIVACGSGSGKGCGGEGEVVTETTYSVETETAEEEVPKVPAYSLEDHVETQSVTESVVANVPQTVTETVHSVEDACGKGDKSCEQEVPTTKTVAFKTVYDTITVTDRKVKMTNHQQQDTLQGAPTYRTVYEDEQHEMVSLQVESVPTTLTETVIKSETRTVTEEVEAGTVLKSVTSTEQGCPEGATASEKGCSKTVTAPKQISCPKGAQLRHGTCIEKSTETVTACPPGATESGKGCEQVETIPATAVYSEPAPAATKEAPAPRKDVPAPTKRGLRMW